MDLFFKKGGHKMVEVYTNTDWAIPLWTGDNFMIVHICLGQLGDMEK